MNEYFKTKHELKEDIRTLADVLKSEYLSEEEKQILRLKYIDEQTFCFIADELGVSESYIKRHHKKLLNKITKILQAGL